MAVKPFKPKQTRSESKPHTTPPIQKASAIEKLIEALNQGGRKTKIGALLSNSDPVVKIVYRKLGGQQELGTHVTSDADLARVVNQGMNVSVLSHFERSGFSKQEIERYVIPARTLRHRTAKQERLTPDESDRVIRLTRIQSLAEDVFGDIGNANIWLRQPLGILDGKQPLDVARTDAGARVIEQILAKIDWGAVA